MSAPRLVRSLLVFTVLSAVLPRENRAENRLGEESSPYLKLHAHNPVDWYPWGEEALDKAKQENKVIFLSVGYSSCYWCHVMERESFMDDEIAAYLNEHFVCIKVDREERPDIDAIYMMAVQLATGRGGWPMSVFLTPDAKPFFGGTYFPARDGDRGASTGFLTLIQTIQKTWKEQENALRDSADRLTEGIRKNLDLQAEPDQDGELDGQLLTTVGDALAQQFDPKYGGFGFDPGTPTRPKFPEPSNLLFLLHQARDGDQKALEMVELTLQEMHAGGIWDHIGGGFHRYSVDRFWHIPHFEKMLYDNAQLAAVYSQAYELTNKEEYRRVVTRLLDWAIREMADAGGGFYSALDAESEQVEGKFYRWEREQVEMLLDGGEGLFTSIYGLQDPPNFEHRYWVPQLAKPLAEIAAEKQTTETQLWQQLEPLHETLLEQRNKRPRPLTDTKILASWNGLMIRGLADAGRVFERPDYTQAARKAANFILTQMRRPDGSLYRTHTAGTPKLNAYLDDYAFVCDGLIALHRATGDDAWLNHAVELTDVQIQLFGDPRGGFYFTSNDHEALIARGKQPSDGAQPAGNSVAAQNLIYLSAHRDDARYRQLARNSIAAAVPLIQRSPRIAPRMALALAEFLK